MLRLVISLALLVGALYAVKYWQRRPGGGRRGAIDVVAHTSLGRNAAVHIIDVGDRRFLIGSGEHQVNLLSELDQPDEHDDDGEDPAGPLAGAAAGISRVITPSPRRSDGSEPSARTRTRPRIGLMDSLRTVTVRTPQQVRVIRDHDG